MGVNQTTPFFGIKAGAGMDSPNFVINSSGNVGIGTNTPTALLTVAGTSDLAWSATTSKLQISRSGTVARLQNYDNGSVASLALQWDGGSVGIGTSSPSTALTIKSTNGNGYALTRPSNDAVEHWRLSTTETGGDAYTISYNTFNCDQIFTTYAGGGTGGNIILRTGATSGTVNEKIRITSAGAIQQKEPAGTLVYQRIVGKKAASSSGTAVTIAYVGHTHSITVRAYVRINDSNGGMITQVFSTAYGSSNAGTATVAAYNQVSNVSLSYNNGAGYMIQVTPTYSGSTPDIYFIVEGVSHDTITVQ
jgi:hypothetical protein